MAAKRIRDEVGIDPNRIVSAALDAALGASEPAKKKRHPGRVLAAGAALAAAAAVGQRRMPRMAKVPLRMAAHKLGDAMHVDELADAVQDRVGRNREPEDDHDDENLDAVDRDDEEFDDEETDDLDEDEEPVDEDEEDLDDEDEEPVDEDEEDLDGEDEEPVDEDEEDLDDEDDDFDDEDDDGFDDEPEDDRGPEGEGEADELDEDSDDDPEGESEDAPDDEEPLEDEDEPEEEPAEDEEPPEDDEEDDEQVAARGLDLGIASGTSRNRPRAPSPDLFASLRTPRRRALLMGRESRRVDPATRPPEPERSRSQRDGGGRANNSKSMAARR